MKRFSIIFIGALAILMASCSKDAPVSPPDENAWINDVNLPVPVQLNSSSLYTVTTKASTDPIYEGVIESLNNKTVQVLGLDKKTEWGTASGQKINPDALLFDTTAESNNTGLTLSGSYYYPLKSEQEYDFYAFYPKKDLMDHDPHYSVYDLSDRINANAPDKDPELPAIKGNQILLVSYMIGYQDVLWGGTTDNDKEFEYTEKGENKKIYGYNAKYIRKVNEYATGEDKNNHLPNLKFKHCLSAAYFKVKAKDEEALDSFEETQFTITKLKLKVKRRGSLILAIREGEDEYIETWEGRMVVHRDATTEVLELKKLSDPTKSIDPVGLADCEEARDLGEGLFLIPGIGEMREPDVYYIDGKIEFTIVSGGKTETKEQAISFPVKDGLQPGTAYTFTMVFDRLQDVTITSSLEEWKSNQNFINNNGGAEEGELIPIE